MWQWCKFFCFFLNEGSLPVIAKLGSMIMIYLYSTSYNVNATIFPNRQSNYYKMHELNITKGGELNLVGISFQSSILGRSAMKDTSYLNGVYNEVYLKT